MISTPKCRCTFYRFNVEQNTTHYLSITTQSESITYII